MLKINHSGDEVSRPMTLYVEEVRAADLKHTERRRVTTIDIEIDPVAAKELIKLLEERNAITGALRFRLMGRLVLT